MLSQNELQIAQSIIGTLIAGRNSSEFDPRSLGGPDLKDISYFNRYIRSTRLYELKKNRTGSYGDAENEPQKVHWFLDHNFEEEDVEDFEFEILRMLNHYNLTAFKKQYGGASAATNITLPDFTAPDFDFEVW